MDMRTRDERDRLEAAVAEVERIPRTHRFAVPPLVGWVTAATAAGAILIYALLIGGSPGVGDPSESAQAIPPSAASSSSEEGTVVRVGGVLLTYDQPPGRQLRVQAEDRVVGFADGSGDRPAPLSYGYLGQELHPDASGVVIADLTGLGFHADHQPPLADSAAALLENMAELNMGSVSQPSYEVDDVEPTELAGWPAVMARVRAITAYPLFEGPGEGGHPRLNLGSAQRVIVVDVGDAIVLVQIWAFDEGRLAAWLPRAQELLDTFRLQPAD